MKKIILPIIIVLSSAVSLNAMAESLQVYAQQCKTDLQIKHIPEFNCFDGIHTPDVDSGAYIGKLDVGNNKVQATYLCRNATSNNASGLLVGLIIQNIENHKACFFDTKGSASNPSQVPSVLANNADTFWKTPDEMVNSAAALSHCHKCHNNDAYLVTNNVLEEFSQLDLLNTDRPLISEPNQPSYEIIGQSFNTQNWNDDLIHTPGLTGCESCHQSSNHSLYINSVRNVTGMPPAPQDVWLQSPLPIYEWGDNGQIEWQNSGSEGWSVSSSTTPSVGTGPSSLPDTDSTYNYETVDHYYFMETSSGRAYQNGDTAILTSPYFNGQNAKLDFDYHMWGPNIGSLYVDVEVNGVWTDNVWSQTGQQTNNWRGHTIDLSQYFTNEQSGRVRFRAVAIGWWQGDIAIGKISLTRKTPVRITNKQSTQCLNIKGPVFTNETASASIEACTGAASEELFITESEPERFRISGLDQGEACIIVHFESNAQGYGCANNNSFNKQYDLWTKEMLSNGYTMFRSKFNSNKCLSTSSDGKWAAWANCSTTDAKQQWKIELSYKDFY